MGIEEIRELYYVSKGIAQSKMDDILENLALLGDVPLDLEEKIRAEKDINILKKWIRLSVKAESIEEFIKEA